MSTCHRVDLPTLGFQLIMPKNLPDHWCGPKMVDCKGRSFKVGCNDRLAAMIGWIGPLLCHLGSLLRTYITCICMQSRLL